MTDRIHQKNQYRYGLHQITFPICTIALRINKFKVHKTTDPVCLDQSLQQFLILDKITHNIAPAMLGNNQLCLAQVKCR